MSTSISSPLDEGFLRRECPHCERQFKWHHGPADARPEDIADPPVYFCPYCGETAAPDQWWTTEQAEYAQQLALGEGMKIFEDEFERLERSTRGGIIEFKFSGIDAGEPPPPLHEPNDMLVVESPCHSWEPIKVDEAWTESLRCIICGAEFAVE